MDEDTPQIRTAPAARILIVDDETAQMRALCDTLGDHGYETTGFAAADAALARLRASSFDLLLADLMMPGMDGIALLQAAREIDADIVGVIMTGEGTIATAVEAMRAGAYDYILKPFKVSAILPVLSRALTMRSLRMQNAELVRLVAERATELERANRDLEAFASSVSHDLRAPLRAIDGYALMLEEDYGPQLDAEGRRLLGAVRSHSIKMDRLINDLLTFSRFGRTAMASHPVAMQALVREAIAEIPDTAGVAFEVGTLPLAMADRALLKQVWLNLLSNAAKFSRGKAEPRVEIGGRIDGSELVYWVRDNGVGFDMRYSEKLFAVFQRLHREEDFAGTGVGLAIVNRIVLRHGGRTWADARLGEGACFYFSLPATTE